MNPSPNQHMKIRAATIKDAQAMIAVKHAAVFDVGSENYPPDQLNQWAGHLDQAHIALLEQRVEECTMVFNVATIQDMVMGYCALDLDTGEVGGPYVRPDHGREGIGSRLLESIEAYASEHQVHHVFAESPANVSGFFMRNEFSMVGPSQKRLLGGGTLETSRVEKAVGTSPP